MTFTAGTDTGTMDGSNSSNQGEDEVTKDGVTIATSNGAFGAAQYRVYKNATLTVSTTSGNITKIELTHNGSKYLASYLSTTIGSYSTDSNDDGTWTGSAASVTFSASSQFRASEIVVTVAPVISDPSSAVAFSDSEPTLDLKDGKTFSQTATTADGYTGTVTYEITANTSDATISGSTLTVAKVGSVTVKATAPAITGFEASTATYTLTVSDTRPEANISWGESEVRIALDANEGEYTLPTLTNENNVDVKAALSSAP